MNKFLRLIFFLLTNALAYMYVCLYTPWGRTNGHVRRIKTFFEDVLIKFYSTVMYCVGAPSAPNPEPHFIMEVRKAVSPPTNNETGSSNSSATRKQTHATPPSQAQGYIFCLST